jgi:creatinine amidohydrolase
LRELRWDGIKNIRVSIISYWDFVLEDTIEKIYPDGFTGWDIEHGGVLETSIMLALYPQFVDMSKVVDHDPAEFPPYDSFPVNPELTPPSGTLSSAKKATAEKGNLLIEVCVNGITKALDDMF